MVAATITQIRSDCYFFILQLGSEIEGGIKRKTK